MLVWWKALPLLLTLAGCAMAGPGASIDVDPKADEDDPRLEAVTLAPAYVLSIASHVVTEDAEGERVTYDSRIDGYVTTETSDEGTALVVVPCHIELPEADGRKPAVSDETVRARPPVVLPTVFSRDEQGLLVATQTGALELGVALDDPIGDELPTDDDDPRIVDHDDDGETGVTIDLDGWEIYLAARASLWLSGYVDEETLAIEGAADLGIDVQIYGDDIPFVDVRARVENGDDEEVVSVENGFVMSPLSEVPTACSELGR